MFARGATPGKVRTWCYDEELEDFTAGKDANLLASLFFLSIVQMPPNWIFGSLTNSGVYFKMLLAMKHSSQN